MASIKTLSFAVLLVSCSAVLGDVSKRTVTTTLYPDCDLYKSCQEALNKTANSTDKTTDNFPNVVYVRAVSGEDILHFALSTVGVPSLLMIHTENDAMAKINVNWDHLLREGNFTNATDLSGAVTVNTTNSKNVRYSFAAVFTKLLEYYDAHDTASLKDIPDDASFWNIRNFTEFTWMNVTKGQGGKSVIFNTTATQPDATNNKTGSLYFEFEINDSHGRDDDLPRLLFNANNTQMNFVLDKFVPTFNKSRFALEVVVVTLEVDAKAKDAMYVEETKSIDDEYSPGVFRVVNWYTQKNHKGSAGYLQWKPVCYLAKERTRSAGTEVSYYPDPLSDPGPRLNDLLDVSLARAYFGNETVLQKSTNISFGLSQDGFYLKNNYTAWTASLGYGTPPQETISLLVIIIIAAGLGIPVIIIIFGGVYVCVRKLRRSRNYQRLDGGGGYARIN